MTMKTIAAAMAFSGLIVVSLLHTGDDHRSLRRRLQDVAPLPGSLWGSSGGGGGFSQGGGSFGAPPQQGGGGFGAPPQHGGSGFGPPSNQGGGGFGPPPNQGGGGFGSTSNQGSRGFGPPPHQGGGGFGPPPNQEGSGFGTPPNQEGGGFGTPPQRFGSSGGPPPQQDGGFGGTEMGGFGGGSFDSPPPQQNSGFGAVSQAQEESPSKTRGGMMMKKSGQEEADLPPPAPAPAPLDSSETCGPPRNVQEQTVTSPTWTASFPGSGIKMLWQSIEQLTGITTADDNDSQGRLQKNLAVTVKTHFPSRHVSPKFFVMDTSKVKHGILVLRNPLDVMPSYFKFLWRFEQMNDPTVEPPIDRWVAWRNENFMDQIQKWAEHADWWVKNYQPDGRLLIIPFEKLISSADGPEMLKSVTQFLTKVDPSLAGQLTPPAQIACVWTNSIGDKAPKKPKTVDGTQYPFTIEQLEATINILKTLKKKHAPVVAMQEALGNYIKVATSAKRKVEKLLLG